MIRSPVISNNNKKRDTKAQSVIFFFFFFSKSRALGAYTCTASFLSGLMAGIYYICHVSLYEPRYSVINRFPPFVLLYLLESPEPLLSLLYLNNNSFLLFITPAQALRARAGVENSA